MLHLNVHITGSDAHLAVSLPVQVVCLLADVNRYSLRVRKVALIGIIGVYSTLILIK